MLIPQCRTILIFEAATSFHARMVLYVELKSCCCIENFVKLYHEFRMHHVFVFDFLMTAKL